MERLACEGLSRVTFDYDRSVSGTGHHAEGTATGFNRKRKSARSHPLFCTITRTDQVLDIHYRSGNVHDSNDLDIFISHRVGQVRPCPSFAMVEIGTNSAFINETIV